jgi:TolB-like protein/DNA-binding winged helix-turn-helix (wHTH) protein
MTARTALFGPYEVHVSSGEVRKHGIRVKIGEQPFKILLFLLERPGEMVAREELRARLWTEDTFVDFDHGLNSAVQRLRDCLSDSAEKPLWVETIPRRGYRFIGRVAWSSGVGRPPRVEDDGVGSHDETMQHGAGEITSVARLHARERGGGQVLRSATISFLTVAVVLLLWPLIRLGARWKAARSEQPATIRSIAVLPLENLSGDSTQDYFADGMTDELITTLGKNRALRITSRTSAMRYRSASRPIREIALELGVDGLIVGSVARSGNRLRVNAQLIRASNDTLLWSESYERDVGDVLSLQEELARAIAEQVRVTSAPSDVSPASTTARFNPEAHDAYLRGRYYWYKGEYQKSREFFQKAIDLDPAYAPGYSGLADSYIAACVSGELPAKDGMPKGEAAAYKSLQTDDSIAETHNSLAAAELFYRWDWSGAEKEIKRALALNPSYSEAHHLYDYILSVTNRASEGLQQERTAQGLDPFARPWAIGLALFRQRRFDEAIQEYRSEVENEPGNAGLHENLAEAYLLEGMLNEAVAENEKALTLVGDTEGATALESIYRSGGVKATLEWRFDLVKKKATMQYVSPVELAELSAGLGRHDQAIHYLEEAFDQHAAALIWLKQDPYLDSLHSDLRYQAIVKDIGLP